MSNEQRVAFQEACIDGNSIKELLGALDAESADGVDCEAWGITEDEWGEAIAKATVEKVRMWLSENESQELLEAIAEWSNSPVDGITIDGQGDIHDCNRAGYGWLSAAHLVDFYIWYGRTYS